MKANWQVIEARIDSMQPRERILLLLATLVLLFFLADSLAFQPVFTQQKQARQLIADRAQQLELLRTRSGLLPGVDGAQAAKDLQVHLSEVDQRGRQWFSRLLAPNQALQILEQVLAHQPGMVLRQATASKDTLDETADDDGSPDRTPVITRHQFELQLEGNYPATRDYLHALEALPWKFFWDDIRYDVTSYPQARITLNIHTLGLQDG
jgi:MSHA biogenesis protein MshJ